MFEPQKVLHLYKEKEKKKPKISGNYMITEKYDGWYCYIDYHPTSGWGYVRNESRVIPSFMFARDRFIETFPTPRKSCRLIMEAYIPGQDFHVTNGIFNRKSEDAKDVNFIVHDMLYLDEFFSVASQQTAIIRYRELLSSGVPIYYEDQTIGLVNLLGVSDKETIWNHYFNQIADNGGEGIILKREDSLYLPGKRCSDLMKIKLEESFDLLVTKMYWTTGEKGNEALNLLLQNKAGLTIPVRVGKDKDIAEFMKHSPVGKVAQIKCMKKLEDGSYREPRFQHIRHDKLQSQID